MPSERLVEIGRGEPEIIIDRIGDHLIVDFDRGVFGPMSDTPASLIIKSLDWLELHGYEVDSIVVPIVNTQSQGLDSGRFIPVTRTTGFVCKIREASLSEWLKEDNKDLLQQTLISEYPSFIFC